MTGKASWGPAPTGTQGLPLSASRRRVLALVGESSGTTVAQAARQLGGHPNSSRLQLHALAQDGLVRCEVLSTKGRGRPARVYRITTRGRQTLARHHQGYLSLTRVFTGQLMSAGDALAAREVGRQWGRELAESAEGVDAQRSTESLADDNTDRLCALLASLDFSPERGDNGELRLHTCPFVDQARADPDVVCTIHQGLIDSVLESWGTRQRARLVPFGEPDACRLQLEG